MMANVFTQTSLDQDLAMLSTPALHLNETQYPDNQSHPSHVRSSMMLRQSIVSRLSSTAPLFSSPPNLVYSARSFSTTPSRSESVLVGATQRVSSSAQIGGQDTKPKKYLQPKSLDEDNFSDALDFSPSPFCMDDGQIYDERQDALESKSGSFKNTDSRINDDLNSDLDEKIVFVQWKKYLVPARLIRLLSIRGQIWSCQSLSSRRRRSLSLDSCIFPNQIPIPCPVLINKVPAELLSICFRSLTATVKLTGGSIEQHPLSHLHIVSDRKSAAKASKIADGSFFTGKSIAVSRDRNLETEIKKLGGKICKNVTKHTDYVILPENCRTAKSLLALIYSTPRLLNSSTILSDPLPFRFKDESEGDRTRLLSGKYVRIDGGKKFRKDWAAIASAIGGKICRKMGKEDLVLSKVNIEKAANSIIKNIKDF